MKKSLLLTRIVIGTLPKNRHFIACKLYKFSITILV